MKDCVVVVSSIIQLEKLKCFLPKVKQQFKKKQLNINEFGTNESTETAQLDLREAAGGSH